MSRTGDSDGRHHCNHSRPPLGGWDEFLMNSVMLARATRVLRPKTIFEMGTYNGLTTAVFELNSEPNSRILTLDLSSRRVRKIGPRWPATKNW